MRENHNPTEGVGNRNELRGMWYVTDRFARVETDFPVHECNFQNRGLYSAIIVLGRNVKESPRIELKPGEVKKSIPVDDIRHIWFKAEKRITKIYYLLKGKSENV